MRPTFHVVCDIDQTVFKWSTREEMLKPRLNKPLYKLLKQYKVLYSTARGKGTRGFSWRPTIEQSMIIIGELKQAQQHTGAELESLHLDKPYAECYIDDKAANPDNFVSVGGDYTFLHKVYESKWFNALLALLKKWDSLLRQ